MTGSTIAHSFRTTLLAMALAAGGTAAQEGVEPSEWPVWHPLREARIADAPKVPSATMSERTYQRLSRAHELLGQQKLGEALAVLDRLGTRNLREYELAQVLQTYGFIHSQRGEEVLAFDAFEKCIELDALPTSAQQGIVYSLAGYYASQASHQKSNRLIQRWFRYEAEPAADAYMLAGTNHVQLQEMPQALPYVRRANALTEAPRENWKQVELAILVQTRRYEEAVLLLEEMVGLWPDRVPYYETLSALLMDMGRDARALAALTIPWLKGLLTEERQILTLARLNLFLENPARAAEILDRSMASGWVQPTFGNLELLLNAWSAAREMERAAVVIDRLAELADDGEYYLRKALLLNETGAWEGVVSASRSALGKGGLERPGDAWMLHGVALAELERYDEALHAFASAQREGTEATRRNAASWIAYVHDRAGTMP